MIQKREMEEILAAFGICAPVKQIRQLLYKEERDGCTILRDILGAETTDGRRYVVKLVSEPEHPTELIRRQILFSETLRCNGAPTARYYSCQKGFTMHRQIGTLGVDISCEDYVGEPIRTLDSETIRAVGVLLGRLHRISLENHCRVGTSKTYREVTSHSRYRKIWHGILPRSVPEEVYRRIAQLHDGLMPYAETVWPTLPFAAVQADIYALNNYTWNGNELIAYDYNLAADEVLIGDLLISWFRTTIHPEMWEYITQENSSQLWNVMLEGYTRQRPLTDAEREALPLLYPLMAAIYASTLAYQFEEIGEYDNAEPCLRHALAVLEAYYEDASISAGLPTF